MHMDQRPTTCGHRRSRTTSRRGLRAALGAAAALAVFVHLSGAAAPLTVERDGDRLRLSRAAAPLRHGRAARAAARRQVGHLRLHRVDPGPTAAARACTASRAQVVFSYDLWEERFSVVAAGRPEGGRVAPDRGRRRGVVRRPPRAARPGGPGRQGLRGKVGVLAARRERSGRRRAVGHDVHRLDRLLQPQGAAAPPRWEASSLPLRLADLNDKARSDAARRLRPALDMGVIRLRHKLVLVFLAATLLPLAAILWMSSALMSRSLAFISTDDVAALAASLEQVGREYYRQARQQPEGRRGRPAASSRSASTRRRDRRGRAAPAVLGQRRRRALRPVGAGRRSPAVRR